MVLSTRRCVYILRFLPRSRASPLLKVFRLTIRTFQEIRQFGVHNMRLDGVSGACLVPLSVLIYIIHIGERAYTNASEFIPERWYSRPEMIKDRGAFAPFSAGEIPTYLLCQSQLIPFPFHPLSPLHQACELSTYLSIHITFSLSLGAYNCIGRPLALLNLRTTIAKLLLTFDIRLAPGEDGHNVHENALDRFTLEPGDLMLVFEKR